MFVVVAHIVHQDQVDLGLMLNRDICKINQDHILQCSVCSVYVHGKDRLTKHIMLSHAVQTGPKTWSCAKCLYPYGDPHDLMNHIPSCPKLQANAEAKSSGTDSLKEVVFYKCDNCSLTFASEEDIKKHMAEKIHGPGTTIQQVIPSNENDDFGLNDNQQGAKCDPATFDRNTCFLCYMRFPTEEMCRKHQHHVHMRWVNKDAIDYSKDVYSGLYDGPFDFLGIPKNNNHGEIGQTIHDIQSNSVLDMSLGQNDPSSLISNLEQFESQINGQQIFTHGTTETADGEQAVTVSIKETLLDQPTGSDFISTDMDDPSKASKEFEGMDFLDLTGEKTANEVDRLNFNLSTIPMKQETDISREYKRLGEFDVSLDDLPDDRELAEIGFPSKVGHFCHLCDAVIKSYRLYYLHMHNLHQLEKRFQCIITACSKTFSETYSFHEHIYAGHNQKSEHYCSMCDNVFADDEELQDHLVNAEHANKNHIQSVHSEIANTCEICDVKLPTSQALWKHLSVHNIVHECVKCHRRFLQKEQLVAHSEVHAPPTPCPWEGCNRKLATKVGLFNHLRIHKGDTDFKCTVCNKGFFKKKTLDSHMKMHDEKSLHMTSSRGRKNIMIGRGGHIDVNQHVEEIQIEQTEESIDSNPADAPIQLVCAGCYHAFDSESHFQAHICNRQPITNEQGQVIIPNGQNLLGGQQIILQTSGDGTETVNADQLVATAHQTLANTLNISSQEFAEQLARVVAEATGPGQVTVSIGPNAKLDENGAVSVSIPEYEDSAGLSEEGTVVFNTENNSGIMTAHHLVDAVEQSELQQMQTNEIVTDEHGNQTILIKNGGNDNLAMQESLDQGKEDSHHSSEQAVFVDSEGQHVLVPVDGNLGQTAIEFQTQGNQSATEEFVNQISMGRNKNDGNLVHGENDAQLKSMLEGQLEGEDSQENAQIVMMVSDDQDGEGQQVPIQLQGDQPYTSAALLKIPTADGGHQMLIIPINPNENGNTVLTLPQGYTIGGDDADGNITLALDPNALPLGEGGEPQQLMLPVDADGQINLESLLQNTTVDALPTEG
ncbi:zinc finger protein 710 [Caerostris extrusa]|uniref:Zinc finger protein 710 n=1 Tax=Caerostris extrusa TaxID=172846 RepID=A0AAV4XE41_CAEEX|nr:zinc finger protein 710 [Caerostris extrusa]